MTHAKAKIWARLIWKNKDKEDPAYTIDDVAPEDRDDVRAAYLELFGEEIAEG